MNEQQRLIFEKRLAQALTEVYRQAAIARRRERCAIGALALVSVVALTGWTLRAQQPKTIEQRIDDLEKRHRFTAPFEIVDGAGKPVVTVANGEFVVGNPRAGGVRLGVGASGAGFVHTLRPTGQIAIGMGQFKGASRLVLFDEGEGQNEAVELIADGGGRLVVLNPAGELIGSLAATADGGRIHLMGAQGADAPLLRLGMGQGKAGGSVELFAQATARPRVILEAEQTSGGVTAYNAEGRAVATLKSRADGVGLVTVSDNKGGTAATVAATTTGGSLRVFTPTGNAVGGLFASESGGGLALTGPGGGNSAVSLGIGENGGKVRVFPVMGGAALAELSADNAGGAVTIYTRSGDPAALLHTRASGAGRLEIGRGGQVMVEAGMTESGLGIVRTGPAMGGVPPGLIPPWAILGKRER